jgi:hypothetical protein
VKEKHIRAKNLKMNIKSRQSQLVTERCTNEWSYMSKYACALNDVSKGNLDRTSIKQT